MNEKRYYSPADMMIYTGMSRGSVSKLAEKAQAIRHVGRRVLIDKIALDTYLEEQASDKNPRK